MYTLAFINQKGGVGKTTLSMNAAVGLARGGAKVLLVDMDPQCSLTYVMHVDKPKTTVLDVLQGKCHALQAVYHAPECDILPSSPDLSLLDRKISGKDKGLRLKEALAAAAKEYHFVVIDSPPALGLLMLNALAAADSVVIPALADIFSLQGIGQLAATIRTVKQTCNPGLIIDGLLLYREQNPGQLDQDVEAMLNTTAQKLGTRLFETRIRRDSPVREAQAMRKSIYCYAPGSPQAADYDRFLLEYLKRLRQRKGR